MPAEHYSNGGVCFQGLTDVAVAARQPSESTGETGLETYVFARGRTQGAAARAPGMRESPHDLSRRRFRLAVPARRASPSSRATHACFRRCRMGPADTW